MKARYIVALLLFLCLVQGVYIAATKSRTVDEIDSHINGGYQYLTTGKWAGGINNPPLSATLAAMPLLFFKDRINSSNIDRINQVDYIKGGREEITKGMLILARLVPILFMLLLGYIVYSWAKDLYGVKAGMLALTLYSFSPTMLAFGSIVTADMGGALFAVLSMYTFWKYMNNPTLKNLIIAGICFGLAQISKMLSVFLVPMFVFYCLLVYFFKGFEPKFFFTVENKSLKKLSDLLLSLVIIFLIGLVIMNAAYMFKGTFTPLSKYDPALFESSTFKNLYKNSLVNWIPIPLPRDYVLGHDYSQWQAKDEVRGFFFLGTVQQSFKSYYIWHILVKTPIGLFALLVLGFLCFRKVTISETYMIFYIFIILFMLTFFSRLLIGYRHVIAIYPLIFILSGRILKEGIPKNRLMAGIAALAVVWYIASSLYVFPHHLAYFNEFIGGPKNGYKYTIDSNLDWEQDLDLVKKYVAKMQGSVWVNPGCQPVTGKVLVPASDLQFQKWVCYQWLKQNFEPVDYIGYSWLVYDVRGEWQQTDNGFAFRKSG